MNKIFISLGGGCDVSTMLKEYNIRKESLPFDWLWNLNEGLSSVTQIIKNNFDDVRNPEDFIYSDHYKWPDKKTLVFKHYPTIAHIHNDFLTDINIFNKRIDRFNEIINTPDSNLVFIYYRQCSEGPEDLSSIVIEQRLDKLLNESIEFFEMMKQKSSSIKLISLFELTEELIQKNEIKDKISNFNERYHSSGICYDFIYPRPNNNKRDRIKWKKRWTHIFLKYEIISRTDHYVNIANSFIKKLKS